MIVPVNDEEEAREIWAERVKHGVHVGYRFDFDRGTNMFWLLSPVFRVVRFGKWNQNNVFHYTEDEEIDEQDFLERCMLLPLC